MPLTNRPQDLSEEAPPSYDDAIKDTLVENSSGSAASASAPALPRRPSGAQPQQWQQQQQQQQPSNLTVPRTRPAERRTASSSSAVSASSSTSRRSNSSASHHRQQHQEHNSSDLYTNNKNLPFNYTRGYYCKKCNNSGYRSPREICRPCWEQFYLNKHSYNPNRKNLPYVYPKGFYCSKCGNTGYKFKNGLTCQNCWSLFGPRNNPKVVNSSFQPSFFGSTNFMAPGPPMGSGGMPAKRVAPGSPELGGLLCGNCRGEGMVHFLFDTDLCPVCGGLGRVFPAGSRGPPPPPPPPMGYPYPYPHPPPPGPPPPGPLQQRGEYNYNNNYDYGRKN